MNPYSICLRASSPSSMVRAWCENPLGRPLRHRTDQYLLCADGKHVVIGGNGDSIFKRLMTEAGRKDMANDPEMEHNQGRVVHEQKIDEALANWCSQHTSADIIRSSRPHGCRLAPSTASRT
ncbi:MAG: hypothetical protein CM15mP92_2700 [Halieaceae bacterium]|nr:MAG: hypothetical protein CM15mP92_2700 [Halieaceae bacterium]